MMSFTSHRFLRKLFRKQTSK